VLGEVAEDDPLKRSQERVGERGRQVLERDRAWPDR
jgi:hypothetical protein